MPGHVTLYLNPHRFYGVQIRMIGRESQTVMAMLPYIAPYCLRHTLAGAFEFYRSGEAQKYEEKIPLNRFDSGTHASNAIDITTTLQYLLT